MTVADVLSMTHQWRSIHRLVCMPTLNRRGSISLSLFMNRPAYAFCPTNLLQYFRNWKRTHALHVIFQNFFMVVGCSDSITILPRPSMELFQSTIYVSEARETSSKLAISRTIIKTSVCPIGLMRASWYCWTLGGGLRWWLGLSETPESRLHRRYDC